MISEPQRHRHAPLPKPPLTTMPSHEAASSFTDTLMHGNTEAEAQEAFTGIPQHLVVTQILKSEYFDDPADLARLPAVSRGMRDAVAVTGLRFKGLNERDAANLGCLSALRRLQRQGRLRHRALLCEAAARSRQLEALKVLRADGWPWDEMTCKIAAEGGHLQVLKWARMNGCPWNAETCTSAAENRHLAVMRWARFNGCPWWKSTRDWAKRQGLYVEMFDFMQTTDAP